MNKVLIADDNPRDQERFKSFLEAEDIEVLICANGAEALRVAGEKEPKVDLAIILWELPDEPCGSELVARLGQKEELPLIVVSGFLDLARAARAKTLGAKDFLLKPLDGDRLRGAVRYALGPKLKDAILDSLQARLIGSSRTFVDMLENLARVIPARGETVLLVGESGTGKELLARAIHELGPQRDNPWLPVNIAEISENLLESHLFGHEAGAFTDARAKRVGYFEECKQGTLFLDEIGDLELSLQVKLLRVIQERQFRRVGGEKDLKFEARIVCATNHDLVQKVNTGEFRSDLYFRIASHEIRVPPLRERENDLWLLVHYFLNKYGENREVRLARETKSILADYTFPGNVRELEDTIKRSLLQCQGTEILLYHLPVDTMAQLKEPQAPAIDTGKMVWPEHLFRMPQKKAIEELERDFNSIYLPRQLEESGGNITRAAGAAEMDTKTFRRKWEKAGLGRISDKE